ncbi:hypothetical protein [Paenibacillus cymbidii]|uniref:hypothetical protein n=1 Tax=Paenibacillus cymbidii TaxID=1639034 RepID=UPI001080C79E|nr:hypothetical protein [Paenibacillus cymbidii]
MAFKLPKGAADYFRLIKEQPGGVKFKYDFDIYYLCLMVGLAKRKLGDIDRIRPDHFTDSYPGPYADKLYLIAGLLVDAEMDRKKIESHNRDSIQNLILSLIDHEEPTKLSSNGFDFLNRYAAGGLDIISDNISRTRELEAFLVHYYNLLNSDAIA